MASSKKTTMMVSYDCFIKCLLDVLINCSPKLLAALVWLLADQTSPVLILLEKALKESYP